MADVKEIKFDDGEMDELQELQSNYQQKQLEFGQIKVQKILLEQQVDALETMELLKFKMPFSSEQGLIKTSSWFKKLP